MKTAKNNHIVLAASALFSYRFGDLEQPPGHQRHRVGRGFRALRHEPHQARHRLRAHLHRGAGAYEGGLHGGHRAEQVYLP